MARELYTRTNQKIYFAGLALEAMRRADDPGEAVVCSLFVFAEQHLDVAKQIDALKDPDIGFGYVEGPGTQGGLDGLGDLMKGDSYRARMDEMYVQFVRQADAWLKENPGADIRVAAIGFSRGAEQAAGFTRLIEERGIQDPAGMNVVRDRNGFIERLEFGRAQVAEGVEQCGKEFVLGLLDKGGSAILGFAQVGIVLAGLSACGLAALAWASFLPDHMRPLPRLIYNPSDSVAIGW